MWWVPLIQAAVGGAQSIYGGIQAGKERAKAEHLQQKQEAEADAYYNNEYYTDYTKRADSQNLLKRLKETTDSNNKRAEMTAAITGATPESVQAQRNANNKVMTDTYGNLAAMGAQNKDSLRQSYLKYKYGFSRDKYNALIGNAESSERGMYNGLGQIGSGLTSALSNYASMSKSGTGTGVGSNNTGKIVDYDYTTNSDSGLA